MSHTFHQNLIHCVFSTKGRERCIPVELQPKLWSYFAGIGRNKNIHVLGVGGMEDHVHILFALATTVNLADAVQAFKGNSSRWLGEHGIRTGWQKGYGAFSVSASQKQTVLRYIANQAEHHKKLTFEDEFRKLLERSGISYEEKYLFG